jgi:hypothetical protein
MVKLSVFGPRLKSMKQKVMFWLENGLGNIGMGESGQIEEEY